MKTKIRIPLRRTLCTNTWRPLVRITTNYIAYDFSAIPGFAPRSWQMLSGVHLNACRILPGGLHSKYNSQLHSKLIWNPNAFFFSFFLICLLLSIIAAWSQYVFRSMHFNRISMHTQKRKELSITIL